MAKSRIEEILENILGDNDPLAAPVSRNEALLIRIYEMLQESKDLKATYNDGTVTISVR